MAKKGEKQPLLDDDADLDSTDEKDELEDGSDSDSEFRELQMEAGKSSDDSVLINAIKVAMTNKKREWQVPDAFSAAFALVSGVGGVASKLVDSAVGESLRLKELVPMSKKRWSSFVASTMAGGYVGAIPGVSIFGAPVTTMISTISEGKGAGNVARSSVQSLGAGAIDSAIDTVTLGGYTIYQLCTAWLASAGLVWLKAKFFYETFRNNAQLFESRLAGLKQVYEQSSSLGRKSIKQYEAKMKWLLRQKKKCTERGDRYRQIMLDAERKFKEGIQNLQERMGSDSNNMSQSLLGADSLAGDN